MEPRSFNVPRSKTENALGKSLRASAAAIAIAIALPTGRAHPVEPLTFARALDLAREQNSEILAARQDLVVAQGHLEKGRYWNPFNPEIEGGAAQRHFDGGGNAVQPSAGISLEVEVAGQRGKRIEEAERNLARVEAEVANVERGVVAEVAEAFYRVAYSRRRLELFKKVQALNLRLRDATVERFESGEASKLDANLGVIRYGEARRQALRADRDYRNAVRELERRIGADPLGTTEILGGISIRSVKIVEQTLLDTALTTRPDLRAREAEIQRVDADLSLTRRLRVPNPTLVGTYEEEDEAPGNRDRIAGGAVRIPLPIFDRKSAELTQLTGERAKAVHERAATELAVRAEVRDAIRSYEAAREAAAILEAEAVGRIDESFGFVETAYREGKIDVLQLIVAQNDLITGELSYLDSLLDYAVARVALERAVGRPLEEGPAQ
jgi:cobalt-zinc-cadmium efflux system outer membrane protein